VSKPFSAIKANTAQLGSAFEGLTGVSLSTAGAFAVMGIAVSKLSDFIKSSVAETVAYGQTVRELSQIIGASAEETSRMIQVADDYLISTEKLTTALRFAVKNGFEPSIDSLAKLADEFNAISDPNERAARMVEIFGRNWSALVPMLKAGGAAIRENAAAINDALVMTEQGQQAIFEYQQSMDNLDDTVQSLKMSIGTALVPALNDALSVINNLTPALNLLDDVAGQNVITAYSLAAAYTLIKSIKLGEDINLQNFAKNTRELNQAIEATQKVAGRTDEELSRMRQDMGVLGEETEDTSDALQDYAKVIQSLNLSTSEENSLIASFGAQIGATGAAALAASNDMALLDAAVKAGAISIQQYTQYAAEAANGTLELDDQTRGFFDSLLEGQDRQAKFRKEMEAAATAVANTRLQLIGLAEQLRQAGPRERRNIVLDQLKELMTGETDPAKLRAIADGITEFEKAVGLITEKDLAAGNALNDLVKALFSGDVDPTLFDDAFNKVNDAIRNWKPGETIDAFEVLKSAGFIPTESDRARIAEEYATIPVIIQEALGGEEGGLSKILVEPVEALKLSVQGLGESIGESASGFASTATSIGAIADNAANANIPLDPMDVYITEASNAASSGVQAFMDLALAMGQAATSANIAFGAFRALSNSVASLPDKTELNITTNAGAATGQVQALADAIGGLGDKEITITVNIQGGGLGYLGMLGGTTQRPTGQQKIGRAAGGPVQWGGMYLVGEQGPELFSPAASGQIIPADLTEAVVMALGAAGPGKVGPKREPKYYPRNKNAPSGSSTAYVPKKAAQFGVGPLDAVLQSMSIAEQIQMTTMAASIGALDNERGAIAPKYYPRNERKKADDALQNAINSIYKTPRSGMGLAEPAPSISSYEGQALTADTQTERLGQTVTYNNYFPIQRVDDELDARALARLVAAEMARMPSR